MNNPKNRDKIEQAPGTTEQNTEATPPAEFEGIGDRDTGKNEIIDESQMAPGTGIDPTAGDIETDPYQARVLGEEAVGGLTPTPEQDITENLQIAAGIEAAPKEPVQTTDKLHRRDDSRWQLDPESSEDYEQRQEE